MTKGAFLGFVIFTGFVVSLCLGLGAWQLQRHYWKAARLAEAQAMASAPAIAPPAGARALQDYRRYRLTGRFLADRDIIIRGFAVAGASGSRLYAPFSLTDGRTLMVQRGWTARGLEAERGVQDRSLQTIEVVWRPVHTRTSDRRLFSLVNVPEQDLWTYIDPAALASLWGLDSLVLEGYGELRAPVAAAEGLTIEVFQSDLFNRHLEYVATWWSLAAGLLGICLLIGWDRRRRFAAQSEVG